MSKYTEDLDKAIEDLDDDIYVRGVATDNPNAILTVKEMMDDTFNRAFNEVFGESHD